MAIATLSQDILAICLVLADGDIHLPMEEIIRRAEDFQETHDRHFGISQRDFRGLFLQLPSLDDYKLLIFGDCQRAPEDAARLHDCVLDILSHYDAYFNDEGDHWCGKEQLGVNAVAAATPLTIRGTRFDDAFPEPDEAYLEKRRLKEAMKQFFESHELATLGVAAVRRFLADVGVNDAILYECSRPWASS
jgi:hypothetical protein